MSEVIYLFQGIEEDIKTLSQNLTNINNTSQNLIEGAGVGDFSSRLTKEVTNLNAKFQEVTKLSLVHSTQLKDSVDQIQKVLERVRELERWADDVIEKNADDFSICSSEDISQKQTKIKVSKSLQPLGVIVLIRQLHSDISGNGTPFSFYFYSS